jgi:transcriptional regulator with XRE-family HTH domain
MACPEAGSLVLMPGRREVPSLTGVIGRQVRHWREDRALSQQGLAERVTALGLPLTARMVASLETDRLDDVNLREIFAIAYVLAVPPILLMLPIGSEDEVEIVPGVAVHPEVARRWVTGERPPFLAAGGEEYRLWYRATAALRLYDRLAIARLAREPTESTYRDVAQIITTMVDAGIRVPPQARHDVEEMDRLGIDHPPIPTWDKPES